MTTLGLLLILALSFDFLNGFHDSANLAATVIASRALSSRSALALVAAAELAGPFLFGTAVAAVIGDGLLARQALTLTVLLAALGAAILWNLLTWILGLPSSSSHALVGGLIGAAIAPAGWQAVQPGGLAKVLLSSCGTGAGIGGGVPPDAFHPVDLPQRFPLGQPILPRRADLHLDGVGSQSFRQ